jgi:hypothetical protein
VRGERGRLNAVKDSPELQDILVRANMLLEGVGCVDAHIGEGMMAQVQRWQKAIPQQK